MKRVFRILISLTSLSICLSACTEHMTIDLDNSYTRLVVYGEITNTRKVHTIKLTRSADYFSNKPAQGVTGAHVSIFDEKKEFKLRENQNDPGVYQTNSFFSGVSGMTYKLEINNVDINEDGIMESYSASTYLPPVARIDSIKLSYLTNSFLSGWQVLLFAMDPADRKDFYLFKVYRNGDLQTDSLSEYFFRSDELFNGNYVNGVVSQFLNDKKSNEKVLKGDTITFELNGINQEYYEFLIEAQIEISPKTPLFSGPSSNVKSNISNNALGFFTSYSIQRASIRVPQKN
jgi:hypothetical protein